MILHNCLSGLAARLALLEEQKEASTPCSRRRLGAAGEVAGQVRFSTAGVGYAMPVTPHQVNVF
jgi:hypothetical protein